MEKIVEKIKNNSIIYSIITSINPLNIELDYSQNTQEIIEYEGIKIFKFAGLDFNLFYIEKDQDTRKITLSTRLAKTAGINKIIFIGKGVAANGFTGDGVLINDHINMSGNNPLIGTNEDKFGVRFPDMTDIYSHDLRNTIIKLISSKNIFIEEGCLLIPKNTEKLTKLEKKVLNNERQIKAISKEIYAGAITGKHSNIMCCGIILFKNICLKEIFL